MQNGWRRVLQAPAILALVQLALTNTLPAQQPPQPQALVIAAENLMAGDARHRALQQRGLSAQVLLPGDVVRYRLTFTNLTEVEARGVAFVDPIPAGLTYVDDSASADRADVRIEYSIDGGTSYSVRPVVVEVVDGKPVERPAPLEAYTHIRWTVTGLVSSEAQVTAQFDARFKTLSPDAEPPEPAPQATESTQQDARPTAAEVGG